MTKLNSIIIGGTVHLKLLSLKDRNQYHDPCGRAERLGITSALWPLFGLIWPAGVLLASKLAKRDIAADHRILEIGCGLGLASLVGHQRGLQITASDYHPAVPDFLSQNVRLNGLLMLPFRYGRWGADALNYSVVDAGAAPISTRYDLVIGSDLLYEPDSAAYVAEYINRVAKPNAEVWVVDPNRGYKNRFIRALEAYGFMLSEHLLVDNEEGYVLNGTVSPLKGYFLRFNR